MRLRREILDRKIRGVLGADCHRQVSSNNSTRELQQCYLIASNCFAQCKQAARRTNPRAHRVFNGKDSGVQIHMRTELVPHVAVAQNYLKVVSYKAKGCGDLIWPPEMNSVRTSRRNGVHTSTINTSGGTIL